MGGQACVYYGALQISKDVDLLVDSSKANLSRLTNALNELKADRIAIPPFDKEYLDSGHSIHFRCKVPEALGLRVDIMSKLRGVEDFDSLYEKREDVQLMTGEQFSVMSRFDLIQAKKTQRDKDWPVISKLAELHYLQNRTAPTDLRRKFWFMELRTEETLVSLTKEFSKEAQTFETQRPLIKFALQNDHSSLSRALAEEMILIKELDKEYWKPLKAELEKLRHEQRIKKD